MTLGPDFILLLGVETGAQGRILQFCPGHLLGRGVIVPLGPVFILLLGGKTSAQGRIPNSALCTCFQTLQNRRGA